MTRFQIIPAIDLINGQCVRLFQGDYQKADVYSARPEEIVRSFIKAGARLIHIIDLDAARTGEPVNLPVIKNIIKKFDIRVQIGGGLRNLKIIEKIFSIGVERAILGTAAFTDFDFLKKALKLYGEKIVVGVDAFGQKIAIKGWTEKISQDLYKTAKNLEKLGVARIIYTDIAKDGTLRGPNLKNLKKLAGRLNIPIIASGGISSLKDILKVAQLAPLGVEGVIVGKAIYTGKVNLAEAVKVISTKYYT